MAGPLYQYQLCTRCGCSVSLCCITTCPSTLNWWWSSPGLCSLVPWTIQYAWQVFSTGQILAILGAPHVGSLMHRHSLQAPTSVRGMVAGSSCHTTLNSLSVELCDSRNSIHVNHEGYYVSCIGVMYICSLKTFLVNDFSLYISETEICLHTL